MLIIGHPLFYLKIGVTSFLIRRLLKVLLYLANIVALI
jgi:hypothetical protein